MRGLREQKHLVLLVLVVVTVVVQPLVGEWSERTQILTGGSVIVFYLAVLLVVFDRRWDSK